MGLDINGYHYLLMGIRDGIGNQRDGIGNQRDGIGIRYGILAIQAMCVNPNFLRVK